MTITIDPPAPSEAEADLHGTGALLESLFEQPGGVADPGWPIPTADRTRARDGRTDRGTSTVGLGRSRRIDAPANIALLACLWFSYAYVRNLTRDTQSIALGNAARLLDVESALGIDIEGALQSAVHWPQAFVAANSYYLLHFPVTLTVLALAYWHRRQNVFPVVRNSLIGCTAAALVVHLVVPMAPPRMLPGFIDAGVAFGPDPYAVAGSGNANQFAAMPSMHVAWAILVGYAIRHLCAHRIGKFVGVIHPVVTGLVVIVTGHHFVSDVAIGAVLACASLVITISIAHRRRPDASKLDAEQPYRTTPTCDASARLGT
jgi:membrane-associated phospholipid phosphatase